MVVVWLVMVVMEVVYKTWCGGGGLGDGRRGRRFCSCRDRGDDDVIFLYRSITTFVVLIFYIKTYVTCTDVCL